MHRRTLALATLALTVFACASSSSQHGREIRIRGPYRHVSGMVFPERAAQFSRTSVRKFPGSADNFGVSYSLFEPEVLVTVYVYPTEGATLEDHFEQIVNDVAQAHNQAPLQQSEIEVLQESVIRGRAATWQYSQQFGPSVTPVRSRAFLFERGKWFVKYRVTNPLESEASIQGIVERLMRDLQMPPDA